LIDDLPSGVGEPDGVALVAELYRGGELQSPGDSGLKVAAQDLAAAGAVGERPAGKVDGGRRDAQQRDRFGCGIHGSSEFAT
jgi:hypothetical protein